MTRPSHPDDIAPPPDRTPDCAARVRPVLDQIADKWAVMILTAICPRPARFNAIRRRLDGITHKALADALKRLERNGLVTRRVLPTRPVGVEYAITPLGLSLRQPFDALYDWALVHGDDVGSARDAYDAANGGRQAASSGLPTLMPRSDP